MNRSHIVEWNCIAFTVILLILLSISCVFGLQLSSVSIILKFHNIQIFKKNTSLKIKPYENLYYINELQFKNTVQNNHTTASKITNCNKEYTNYKNNRFTRELVCRECLKGGSLSIGKIIKEIVPLGYKQNFLIR